MSVETTIILCGGPINYGNLPTGMTQSNAMIPVNGKPVIGWILDDLIGKQIRHVTLVVREQDYRLQEFLRRAYSTRLDLHITLLRGEGTIVQSLQAGLQQPHSLGLVRIILGDTLIRDPFDLAEDFVYVGEVAESRRWCLAISGPDRRVVDYLDKQEQIADQRLALAGYYHFLHGEHLRGCVERSVANGDRELSDVLRRYGASYALRVRPAEDWYDFGHIDTLVDSRRRLLQPRFFNSLSINPVLNTIAKVSRNDQKLRDELDWYFEIPDHLKVLTPRILSQKQVDQRVEIVQEYYGYPTLAELYVYGNVHTDVWASVLRHVLRVHQEFRRYPGQLAPEAVQSVYLDKTWQRLDLLIREEPEWAALLEHEAVTYNGAKLHGLPVLRSKLIKSVEALIASAPISVIHGDFCFSNILFDLGSQIIRLIDPRGSFGQKGIYGDARYDIAKLRHSVCSLYDYIIADMFELRAEGTAFEGQIYANGTPHVVRGTFDRMIKEFGYKLEEIKLIEGLLFISMLPLHQGHPARQRMMFLTGLSLLNEVLR